MQLFKFDTDKTNFFKSLRKKVDDLMKEQNIHPAGNTRLYLKGGIQVATAMAMYITLVFFTPIIPIAVVLCILLGVNLGVIGFNIMHEGCHSSFSKYAWINRISSYFLNILGASNYYWKIKHNINHHTFTNVEGMDTDIDVRPFMRLHSGQPLRAYHKFQHFYWVILYGMSYLTWVFYDDFNKYFSGRDVANGNKKSLDFREHIIFWITKLTYISFYIGIPIFMLGWATWLIGFFIITFTTGLSISIVFQLAHVVETTQFVTPVHDQEIKTEDWAIHQLLTTSNFATSSKTLYWLLGGLNFQIEHHLFPRISHIHYPKIGKLVKETCEEYNVVYNEYSTMFKAIASHLMHLRKMGNT